MKAPKTTKRRGQCGFFRLTLGYAMMFLVCIMSIESQADEYHVDKDKTNSVKFISEAPFDNFEGVTDRIDGYVYWENDGFDLESDYSNSEFYFEIELASLDTGISLRNRHMRENYLETDDYPYVSYKGKITSVTAADTIGGFVIASNGLFSLHGVDREFTVLTNVTREDGDFRVRGEFDVKLSDYNIDIPSLMFLKINETIHLIIDFRLKKVN